MSGRDVLRVTVTARQRLALGVGSEVSFYTDSHRYAPGSVLRGALAAAWIAGNGLPLAGGYPEDFRELFDGAVRYGPLFVPGTVVVPVSAWLCKYPADGQACREQAVDAAFEKGDKCPACGGPLERGKGQVNLPGEAGLERITRTSIDKETGKAADGELYANAALPAGTVLAGYIHGRSGWLESPRRLRLGGRRTVSGAADYQAVPLSPGEEDPLPYEWPGLPAEGAAFGPLPPDRLVIRLASPAVFTDPYGRPLLEPHPDLDLAVPGLGRATVDRRWARPVTWSGWHAASRLPKPDEACAGAGSTYRLAGAPEVLRALAEKLAWDGAGLRRGEGFGVVRIARRPWRPPVPAPGGAGGPQAADAAVTTRLDELRALGLTARQWNWAADALRELQLIREHAARGAGGDDPVSELLSRPAAGDLSGRQRDRLRGLFGRLDRRQLRDLTTLLAWEGDQ